MDFVSQMSDVQALLGQHGITPGEPEGADGAEIRLRMADGDEVTRFRLTTGDSATASEPSGARVITIDLERLAAAVEEIIQRLHLSPVLLVPVAKWRDVFDAVAFSLADNEDWQEVDAAASVELHRRDPLVCEPPDYHTVGALVRALLSDGETSQQGLMITSTAAPLLVEVIPGGTVRIDVGSRAIADEIVDAVSAESS